MKIFAAVNNEELDRSFTIPVHAAGSKLRQVSTLKQDETFALDPKSLRSGFMYFYRNMLRAQKPDFTFAALIGSAIFPGLEQRSVDKKNARREPAIESNLKMYTEKSYSRLISVKKDLASGRFKVSTPIFSLQSSAVASLYQLLTGKVELNEMPAAVPLGQDGILVGNLRPNPTFRQQDLEAFASCHSKLMVRTLGDRDVYFIDLEISKEECEFLVNMPWIQIRPLDIFGPLQEWSASYYGRYGPSPLFSLPLSKIAASLVGSNNKPRVSSDGLIIDEHSTIMYVPGELNSISRFEDLTTSAFTREDGSFSPMAAVEKNRKPPSAMPVLADWTNLKFAYTTLEGKLIIKNLDRTLPLSRNHYVKFLTRKLDDDTVKNFITTTCNVARGLGLDSFSYGDLAAQARKLGSERDEYVNEHDIGLYEIFSYAKEGKNSRDDTTSPAGELCAAFVKMVRGVLSMMKVSSENLFVLYSVTTILELHASLIVFDKYGPRFMLERTQDESDRAKYTGQGADPEFVHESLPYISEEVGKLPHQVKVANVMRDSPDNAMLPVDTGGGKSMICITDILKEMKSKPGPYLILAPSHLVAQYVKEFVYFTKGRINCIPISSYTIRRQGFDRLQAMVENMPVNSVVVSDYNAILLKRRTLSYGVSPVTVFPVVEFLRQFEFKYVFCDESHMLRNQGSRQSAVNRLIADIPKKRLASGTFVSNTLIDLVRQTALLDPTILGTTEDFISEYALEVRGTKVLAWKPGAEAAVKSRLKDNCVIAEAKKKEWAAILPLPREFFHKVDLFPKQLEVYNVILKEVVEKITAEAQHNEALKNLLSGVEVEGDEDELSAQGAGIDGLLKPYLSRLEQFITAPGKDALGSVMLTGEDLVSPKALEIVKLTMGHIQKGIPGKVLIFTNYSASAKAIYEAFPDEFKDSVVYYTADRKEECGAEFEKNPKKLAMVGVENSMNTGLNLQHASRLIRCETVWTPGILEQGNARIGRPNIKNKENRPEIYYDWIISNHTIDVTKISYLMSKTISKAKFDEAGNNRFDILEVPKLFPMTLDVIMESNDFNETMADYFGKYESFKQAVYSEYADYRVKNKDILFNADGSLKIAKLEKAPNLPGSSLMVRVPYVPGTELYKSDQLGLKRYDEFFRLELEDTEEDAEDDNESADDKADVAFMEEQGKAIGLACHTDKGDGEIVRVGPRTITVLLPSGERVLVRKLSAFIITRPNTSTSDIRNQLLKLTGDVPLSKPIEVLETKLTPLMIRKMEKQERVQKRQLDKEASESVSLNLEFTIINDYLGIRMTNVDNEASVRTAQAFGFKYSPDYFAAKVPTPRHMMKLFETWAAQDFTLDGYNSLICKNAYEAFVKSGKKAIVNLFGISVKAEIQNFYRMEFKPNPDKNHINPYPLIQDNQLYIALPKAGQPGSMRAITKAKVPGVRWMLYEKGSELICFVSTKQKAAKLIQLILAQGVTIPNKVELVKQLSKLKVAREPKA